MQIIKHSILISTINATTTSQWEWYKLAFNRCTMISAKH